MRNSIYGLDTNDFCDVIARALKEDIGAGDITSQLTIPEKAQAQILFAAREELVGCGTFVAEEVYRQIDWQVRVTGSAVEGKSVPAGTVLAIAAGPARSLLAGERVVLNLMQRMSGIATLTRQYVEAVRGTKAIILDTRKTTPGLRNLEKFAVQMGGGQNHRMCLDDMVLIKDNHIELSGGIAAAVKKARAGTTLAIEVECDTLSQVKEALAAKPDRILLDNMSIRDLQGAVRLAGGKVPLEASGGVSLETARAIAETGVDYISVGKLTHSARAMDIGADITFTS